MIYKTFETIDSLKEYLTANGFENSIVYVSPSYIDAVIGVSKTGKVVYDGDKVIKFLCDLWKDDFDTDEDVETDAIEWISYNMSLGTERAPIILWREYADTSLLKDAGFDEGLVDALGSSIIGMSQDDRIVSDSVNMENSLNDDEREMVHFV